MLPRELIRKVRHIEIRTRRLVNDMLAGQYQSVFKGRGMTFDHRLALWGSSGSLEHDTLFLEEKPPQSLKEAWKEHVGPGQIEQLLPQGITDPLALELLSFFTAVESWEDYLRATVDEMLDYFLEDGEPLSTRTWGQRNTVVVQHPLSLGVPFLGRWLDMPRLQLPGDNMMPRVQGVSAGASERLVVSPGREQDGIFHMPTGQSGHPLSPHYADAHPAWADGTPTPFLPGPPVHTLTLIPE